MPVSRRLLSLDVFRGMTIAGMILVNTIVLSPFPILEHANWNDCTLADLVFPFFLVVMGMSLVFSMAKHQSKISHSQLLYKIFQRTLIIFGLGLLLNVFPHHLSSDTLATARIYGVLQRIALCYGVAALAYLYLRAASQTILAIGLLLGYWLLMRYYPVPGYGMGDWSPAGNLSAYVDRILFDSKNLYGKVFDPEGLLSTLPAIASTLLGNLTGLWLLSRHQPKQKCWGILGVGIILALIGWVWGFWFPINKALWTSSYALWTGGLALIGFAICYALIEINHIATWSKPFEIFGLNAIVAYFFHVLLFKIQLMIHVSCGQGKICNLRQIILQDFFGWASLPYASLFYALSSVLFWLLVLTILYKRKIFIKI